MAGGGDTVAALNAAGVAERFTYVSTAGGAFLEWLEGQDPAGRRGIAGEMIRLLAIAAGDGKIRIDWPRMTEEAPMNLAELNKVAEAMVAPGRGILAADESSGTIKKRFDAIGVEVDARQPPRLSRAPVPLVRGDVEIYFRRHPL